MENKYLIVSCYNDGNNGTWFYNDYIFGANKSIAIENFKHTTKGINKIIVNIIEL